MNGYFVTGTDTNVGKTFVSCALARRAVSCGHRVVAFKPVETGCALLPDGSYRGDDQELLADAAGGWQTGPLRGIYRYPLPAAPLVAAEHAGGDPIDLGLVERTFRDAVRDHGVSFALVEGAGGWRVPITSEADMSTLARRLALPVIIVARAGLGTINHTLLTIEAVERDGCRVGAVILSQRGADDPEATLSNRDQIVRRWSGLVLVLAVEPAVLDGLIG